MTSPLGGARSIQLSYRGVYTHRDRSPASTRTEARVQLEDGGGGAEGDRTPDLRIANATLYQLSYRPTQAAHDITARRRRNRSTGRGSRFYAPNGRATCAQRFGADPRDPRLGRRPTYGRVIASTEGRLQRGIATM